MFTKKNTIRDVMTDPKIAPYAPLFVTKTDLTQHPMYTMSFEELSRYRMFHGYSLLSGVNRLAEAVEDGEFCYNLYSAEEIQAEPKKGEACFLHFPSMDPGADDKPFVLIVPGGGNVAQWNLTEGFPIAAQFNRLGYHAVILVHRVGGPKLYPAPTDDLAQLLRQIEARKEKLSLNAGRYITVGFSAGGYLVNTWSGSIHGYPAYGLPKPEMNISVYGFVSWRSVKPDWDVDDFGIATHGLSIREAAQTDWNVEDSVSGFPPTYIIHGGADQACDCMNSYVLSNALQEAGIPQVLEIGKGTNHGFGEGCFTPLRGWIERAVNYFENLKNQQ